MRLLATSCHFRSAPVEIREKIGFSQEQLPSALDGIGRAFDCEAVILSTCNRVEVYLARPDDGSDLDPLSVTRFISNFHGVDEAHLSRHLTNRAGMEAVRHIFRVAGSLDSLVVGEGQISGQVKQAYETARTLGAAGPVLHALFQQARVVAKRVRAETGISQGHVSVSSVAVDYVREVFDRYDDKTISVLGAGKMGELTLKSLRELSPGKILICNRSSSKAEDLASQCGGEAVPWDRLDDVLIRSDIILSTTGAPDVIVDKARWEKIAPLRRHGRCVILDIAVPRDFDPSLHNGDTVCLFNIDDLQKVREGRIAERRRHLPQAELLVESEASRFIRQWDRRRNSATIAKLTREFEDKRQAIVSNLMTRLNGKLSEEDKQYIAGAFRLLQNQFLHGPIATLTEETGQSSSHTLLDAFRKLFRLEDQR
ncbi:MAG: glutamyl-tRNA reductase [Planctomycetota bacterium]